MVTLTDILGSGLDFSGVSSAGIFTCNGTQPLVCTLPAGTVPGTYSLTYRATVNAQASASVRNAVLGSGTDNPSCSANFGERHRPGLGGRSPDLYADHGGDQLAHHRCGEIG
ncbi:hypothetical protein G6F58_013569 [Rhizopus delemar]|nr:hypothetical protein G6F58_013569 [Rhizopus delemar]